MADVLTIALSKGRIYQQALPLLAAAQIVPLDDPDTSRKLILDTSRAEVKLVVIRAADVPTYVEYGAADLGVVGKDVLMEHDGNGLYEPVDLRIARCRLMLAGLRGAAAVRGRMRVATKYVRCTREYFAREGRQVEIIKLYGAMELAPIVGLADRIVDLVETGATMRANGLEPTETIAQISSRLVVNKAAMKMKHRAIEAVVEHLRTCVDERSPVAEAKLR
jgi:ATP phosphoribosyltransferase